MIIIEGTDKLGKSTLAAALAERIGGTVEPWGLLPDNFDFFWGYVEKAYNTAVWDRGWLSEIAYGDVLNRKTRLSREHRILVQQMLRMYGVVNVVITADPCMLKERLRTMPDDKFDPHVVMSVNDWFIRNYLNFKTDHITHCTPLMPFPSEVTIEGILKLYNERLMMIQRVVGDEMCLIKNITLPWKGASSAGTPLRAG